MSKKTFKKAMVVLLTATMSLGFTACGSKETEDTADKAYEVGILQLVEHDALDAANKGFCDALAEEGINVNYDQQNAQGEQANCQTIASKFVNDGKDLILAIATPAAQAVASETTEIPILVTAVTDPADAGLVDTNEVPGGNVSGTSDLTPVAEQLDLLVEIMPEAKKVGILYCSSESNSVFQANLAKEKLADLGLEAVEATVSNSNEIEQVTRNLAGKVDAIYAPTDNMIAAGMATVSMVATECGIPIIAGESGMLENGGLATVGISYYNLGVLTGHQAAKILRGEAEPATMPIEYDTANAVQINQEIADELGITIPQSVLDRVEE